MKTAKARAATTAASQLIGTAATARLVINIFREEPSHTALRDATRWAHNLIRDAELFLSTVEDIQPARQHLPGDTQDAIKVVGQ